MKVEVSIGEAIDKLSVLELKLTKIKDEKKCIEIQKEIDVLQECQIYKELSIYYKLLMYVNEKIWDLTDIIKSITPSDSNFANLSNTIFEFNQKRFRIKNWYNLTTQSDIKEQKSYSLSKCKVIIANEEQFFNKIPELIYLILEYDTVTIVSPINDKIKPIFTMPTILYSDKIDDQDNTILLDQFKIPSDVPTNVYEFKPIVYASGGLLGDFVHQLSVINEHFLNTGRKGVLYIANNTGGDNFRYDLSKTYQDTYKLVTTQRYIKEYKVYNNEHYDINLSSWRASSLLFNGSWERIFQETYNVNWGKNKWIDVTVEDNWKDIILVNTTSYRNPYNVDFKKIYERYGDSVLFITLNQEEYTRFVDTYKIESVKCFIPNDIYSLCVAINSCKLFIGNLSSPLAFAYGMHKQSVVGLFSIDGKHHIGLDKSMSHLIIHTDKNVVMENIKTICG